MGKPLDLNHSCSPLGGEGGGGGIDHAAHAFDPRQFVQRQAQRFFDEHVLAGGQGTGDQAGVAVVPSDDGHGVDGRIGQQGVNVSGSLGKPGGFAMNHAAHAAGRHDSLKLRPGGLERGNQDA